MVPMQTFEDVGLCQGGDAPQRRRAMSPLADPAGWPGRPVACWCPSFGPTPAANLDALEGSGPGDFGYDVDQTGVKYQLTGYGADGQAIITAPW